MIYAGNGTFKLEKGVSVVSFAATVGKKEGEGPLGKYFDAVVEDEYHGKKSWEKAESAFLKQSVDNALLRGGLNERDIDFAISGDLLNQCTSAGYAFRDIDAPFLGIFGACSTMAEGLAIGTTLVGSGADYVLCATSSHFCGAEKQFRMPLEYGSQRCPTAQWTVTGSGAVVLGKYAAPPYIESITVGRIVDMGVKDACNMGAAMAPAFTDTLLRHLSATGRQADYYDLILSGDLGIIGKKIATELLHRQNVDIAPIYNDCGAMIFDPEKQDTHAGGSGCGCAASVLCSYVLPKMMCGRLKRVLLCATGALMSPTVSMQGESIPSVSHAISFEA